MARNPHRRSGSRHDPHVLFRQINDQIVRMIGAYNGCDPEFLCECGDVDCLATVQLPLAKYRAIRWNSSRFLISPGHEDPGFEQVVERNGTWAVVELLVAEDVLAAERR